MSQVHLNYAIVASGDTVSNLIAWKGATSIGLWVPTVTSADLYIQTSFDQTSGNFVRAFDVTSKSQWNGLTGAGSASVALTDSVLPFPYGRIELGAAQTDPRTIVVCMKI